MNTLKELLQEEKALYQQEELLLEVTELLATMMQDNNTSKADLARRIGKSKAYVTQCLSGSQNLTLRTISDLFFALGYRLQLGAVPSSQSVFTKMLRLYPVGAWAMEQTVVGQSPCGNSEDLLPGQFCEAA